MDKPKVYAEMCESSQFHKFEEFVNKILNKINESKFILLDIKYLATNGPITCYSAMVIYRDAYEDEMNSEDGIFSKFIKK